MYGIPFYTFTKLDIVHSFDQSYVLNNNAYLDVDAYYKAAIVKSEHDIGSKLLVCA